MKATKILWGQVLLVLFIMLATTWGATNRSVYCASKWALEGMSKAIALDLAPHGIRSNTIAPTFIETPMALPFLRSGFSGERPGKDQTRATG